MISFICSRVTGPLGTGGLFMPDPVKGMGLE